MTTIHRFVIQPGRIWHTKRSQGSILCRGLHITRSKLQLQPVLHEARIHAHGADLSESARTRDIARGICKVRVIKNVENLPAKDDPDLFCELGPLDESDVEVVLVWPPQDVSA